jgi:hypothetical protein
MMASQVLPAPTLPPVLVMIVVRAPSKAASTQLKPVSLSMVASVIPAGSITVPSGVTRVATRCCQPVALSTTPQTTTWFTPSKLIAVCIQGSAAP